MTQYTVFQSKKTDNYHILVREQVLHPKLGIPVGEKVGFSLPMTQEQAEIAIEACNSGELAYELSETPNEAGVYNVTAKF